MPDTPRLDALREKHRALDGKIKEVQKRLSASDGEITEMKRRKLALKEEIERHDA